MHRAAAICLVWFCLAGNTAVGQYGNYKFNNYGSKSILLTGNVTGTVDDLGLTYYNPARLSLITSNGISINAKAYEYRSDRLEDAFEEDQNLKHTSFRSLPAMVAGTFSLFGTRFAYSFFNSRTPTTTLDYNSGWQDGDIVPSLPGEERYISNLGLSGWSRFQLYGLAWAYSFSDRLSVGISMFGAFYNTTSTLNLEYAIEGSDGGSLFAQNELGFYENSYGLLAKIGFSYRLPTFDLGVAISLPYMQVRGKSGLDFNETVAGVSPEEDRIYDYRYEKQPAEIKVPFGISVGAGIPFGRHILHLNIDYMADQAEYSRIAIPSIDLGGSDPASVRLQEDRNAVFNFGIGAEVFLSDRVMLYSGFSTDRNAIGNQTGFLEIGDDVGFRAGAGSDYFHLGLGTGLQFKWGKVFLGVTSSRSLNDDTSPFRFADDPVVLSGSESARIQTRRWQFLIGLDFPFLSSGPEDATPENTD